MGQWGPRRDAAGAQLTDLFAAVFSLVNGIPSWQRESPRDLHSDKTQPIRKAWTLRVPESGQPGQALARRPGTLAEIQADLFTPPLPRREGEGDSELPLPPREGAGIASGRSFPPGGGLPPLSLAELVTPRRAVWTQAD
jgi:hypothetical protein